MIDRCPACGSDRLAGFHRVEGVPTNSCLLLDDREAARAFPRGDLDLAVCHGCGFITNRAFDPGLAEYSARYEETQSYSSRFVDFARSLAKDWVERYRLHDRHVLEIGCGKGEFLVWMVDAGAGSGTGVDPGVHPERLDGDAADRIRWVAELYDERFRGLEIDAVVCRHTLEHLQPVADVLRLLADNLDGQQVPVLFELPDAQRVLDEVAFWDLYYEHCSYFTAGSLGRLFAANGFAVRELTSAYDEQYLLLEAASPGSVTAGAAPVDDLADILAGVDRFTRSYRTTLERWRRELDGVADAGGRAVIWGGGSKGVSFLTTLGVQEQVLAAVDINPHKQGRFIAGTGHPVIAPDELRALGPDLVVAMNPIYLDEIRGELDRVGLSTTRLVAV